MGKSVAPLMTKLVQETENFRIITSRFPSTIVTNTMTAKQLMREAESVGKLTIPDTNTILIDGLFLAVGIQDKSQEIKMRVL